MAANPNLQIPVLTEEIIETVLSYALVDSTLSDREALIAELQTQIAAGAFELTDDIMRKAFAEMEASIFEQISSRLRRDLPEMVDELERLKRRVAELEKQTAETPPASKPARLPV